jgi:hypothetical protein
VLHVGSHEPAGHLHLPFVAVLKPPAAEGGIRRLTDSGRFPAWLDGRGIAKMAESTAISVVAGHSHLSRPGRCAGAGAAPATSMPRGMCMTTNELMRHLLTDISAEDQRHLVEVVDRNHAEQLARKRRATHDPEVSDRNTDDLSFDESDSWVDEAF